jgi:hypothetical protein
MPIDDDIPKESPYEKAKRIWSNYAVEKSFKEARKAIADTPTGAPLEIAPPQIASTIESDEFKRKKLEKRANKLKKEILSPIIDDLKQTYEATIQAQQSVIHLMRSQFDKGYAYRQMLIQKLNLLEELERRRKP